MIELTFTYYGKETIIQCNLKEKIKSICIKYGEEAHIDISKVVFIYNGIQINEELTLENIVINEDNKRKNINIIVQELKDYNNNHNNFKKKPNFKFKGIITSNNYCCYGSNDIFEVFISYKDNRPYLITKTEEHNLELYNLVDYKVILSLKGHKNYVTTIRYFINKKNNNEYLISADNNDLVIIWDITNNYNILYKINVDYQSKDEYCINSCLLLFDHDDNKDNYIIISKLSDHFMGDISSTKIYSLNNGNFIKDDIYSKGKEIYYLLPWYNKKNNKNYIAQFAAVEIIISNLLEDELYCLLSKEPESHHYYGIINNKNNNDYLCSSSTNGYVNIWDLYNKNLFKVINLEGLLLTGIIEWNEKYIIVAEATSNSFIIIDLMNNKVINQIKTKHEKSLLCIKKIYHPIYGETLISAAEDNSIYLWII